MDAITQYELDEQLQGDLRRTFERLGLRPVDSFLSGANERPTLRRRGLQPPPTEMVELLSLARDPTGVLRWEPGVSSFGSGSGLRRAGRAALPPGKVVQQFAFQQIPPNEVTKSLETLDNWLTPKANWGLRQWNPASGVLEPFLDGSKAGGKRVLLIIHGTFSNSENVLEGIEAAPNGRGHKLLADAAKKYDLVLTFDHPTVGASPFLNAFDLAAALRPLPKALDIICHSRGGLVTRWFLEALVSDELRKSSRAILVGSTIGGTSLASPARLKAAMDYLANLGEMLGHLTKLGSTHPFIGAAGIMMQVFTSVTRFAAKTPMFDAAIALVPGLHGQSLIGNNPEILRLRANTGACYRQSGLRYFAVTANFEPKDPGWNFLQYFSKPMQRMANWGADLVFDGPNDLVADVSAMTDIATDENGKGLPMEEVLDFGTTDAVHHTNYFRQEKTLEFIAKSLGI